MTEFPLFSKSFGPGDTEIFEIDGRKTYASTPDKTTNMIEIVLIHTNIKHFKNE